MSDFNKQYDEMWQAIRGNIVTIRTLLDQADQLNNVVMGVDDEETKARLRKGIDDLYKTIQTLITHTDYLFDQFKKLAGAMKQA